MLGAEQESAVLFSHRQLFERGGKKGLFLAQASDSEFAARITQANGYTFWASSQNFLLLDREHARNGKEKNERKVDFHATLEMQNGLSFGPKSFQKPARCQVPRANH